MFKFELKQFVEIRVSGEMGHVKARAEYSSSANNYLVHYKAADGRAVSEWFDEFDIVAVEDADHPGMVVYAAYEEDIPQGAVINA